MRIILSLFFLLSWLVSGSLLASDFVVDIYDKNQSLAGNTIFGYNQNLKNIRIIEVNSDGKVVWSYSVPKRLLAKNLKKKTKVSIVMDAKVLDNQNVLFTLRNSGVYEVNRQGDIVWQHLDKEASHDVDRLNNGNTIYARTWVEKGEDWVIEVDQDGQKVWSYDGVKDFDYYPFSDINLGGWAHANSVERLPNGNTLITPRNFQMVVELDNQGRIVWRQLFDCPNYGIKFDVNHEGSPVGCMPHGPEIDHKNNALIIALRAKKRSNKPDNVYFIDRSSGDIVNHWTGEKSKRIRDIDLLSNGNLLIQDNNKLIELNPNHEVVWQLRAKKIKWNQKSRSKALYKAHRITPRL